MPDEEVSGNPAADRLNAALMEFAGCVVSALEDICTYSVTIGQAYVPFNPDDDDDCDPDEAICSQAWVRVMNVQAVDQQYSFAGGDGCSATLRIQLEVGVLRCVEIPEKGEAPTATDVLVASMQAMTDMLAIQCAAQECDSFMDIQTGQWSPSGPLGSQYGGIWTFSVDL